MQLQPENFNAGIGGFLETNFRKVIIMMEWLSLTNLISRPSS